MNNRKLLSLIIVSIFVSSASIQVQAATSAGDSVIYVVVPEAEGGWSVKKNFLGKAVYNENKQKIGTITDLLVDPDTNVAFVVIGAGGFVGLGRHNVAVRTSELRAAEGKFMLPGRHEGKFKGRAEAGVPQEGSRLTRKQPRFRT